jgi:hypothetical protein
MSLLNAHLFGADPEFVVLNGTAIVPYRTRVSPTAPWGIDHGGYVIEPHPKPEKSVRKLIDNLKVSFNDFAVVAPEGKWRAGAFVSGTTPRNQSLGGHIHIDQPKASTEEVIALDRLASYLEKLDILPSAECQLRRDTGGYGRAGDIRAEHGHWEYRSLPSWLYSQRVTKLCLVGAKLASLQPKVASEHLTGTASLTKLRNFYESFKNKDDDADWFLDGGILEKKLSIDVTRDLKEVWKVEPKKEEVSWKKALQPALLDVPAAAGTEVRPVARIFGNRICLFYGQTFTDAVIQDIEIRLAQGDCRPGALHRTPRGWTFMLAAEVGLTSYHWCTGPLTIVRRVAHGDHELTYKVLRSQIGNATIQRLLIRERPQWEGRVGRGVFLYGPADRQVAVSIENVERIEEEDDFIDIDDEDDDEY